jgi:hypothetical protein
MARSLQPILRQWGNRPADIGSSNEGIAKAMPPIRTHLPKLRAVGGFFLFVGLLKDSES